MLVLSRSKEEEIVIGDGIVIKVVEITGNKVKIGITAPPSVVVVRGELKTLSKGKKDGVERQAT